MSIEEINLNKLVDTIEDEKTGAHARKGFTYQDWWATHKSFEMLSTVASKDFAIGVEIKEDVIVIDSLNNPQQLDFYQIKKKEPNNWTITGLLKAEKKVNAKEKSTVSKLYSRYLDFKTDSTRLFFISNTQLQLEKKENENITKYFIHDSNFFNDFDDGNLKKIEKKVKLELNLEHSESIKFDRLNYQRSNISPIAPDISVIGSVTTFNDDNLLPFKLNNISSVCRLLAIKFQSLGMNTDFARNFDQLKKRCLTKIELVQFLNNINEKYRSPENYCDDGLKQLQSESYPFPKMQQLKDEIRILLVDITDRTKLDTQDLFHKAFLLYNKKINFYLGLNSLTDIINNFSEDLSLEINGYSFNINYLKSVTLILIISKGEVYNDRYFNIPTTQTDSKQT